MSVRLKESRGTWREITKQVQGKLSNKDFSAMEEKVGGIHLSKAKNVTCIGSNLSSKYHLCNYMEFTALNIFQHFIYASPLKLQAIWQLYGDVNIRYDDFKAFIPKTLGFIT